MTWQRQHSCSLSTLKVHVIQLHAHQTAMCSPSCPAPERLSLVGVASSQTGSLPPIFLLGPSVAPDSRATLPVVPAKGLGCWNLSMLACGLISAPTQPRAGVTLGGISPLHLGLPLGYVRAAAYLGRCLRSWVALTG